MDTIVYLVDTPEKFHALLRALENKKYIGIDFEFTDLDVYASTLLLMSIAYAADHSYVLDFTKLPLDYLKQLKPILESPDVLKLTHYATIEYKQLYHNARIMMQNIHDTLVVEQMIFGGLNYQFDLKAVTERRLGITRDKTIRKEFTTWQEGETFTQEQIQYSGEDASSLISIYFDQMKDIDERGLQRIYDLEMAILAPTAIMEYTGIPVNKAMLQEMIEPFTRFANSAEKAFQDILIEHGAAEQLVFDRDGYKAINANSVSQVKEALVKLGIEIRNQQGKLSLDSKIVQRWDMLQAKKKGKRYKDWEVDYHTLLDDDEVADALDLYTVLDNKIVRAYVFMTGARKLISTFIIGLIDAVNPVTTRVHAGFKSYGAHRTGRYSSTNPNFQNLPNDKKLEVLGLGKYSIRQCIQASKGRKLIISDYSGVELVILAVLSGDKQLLDQILLEDIHTFVTHNVLGYKEITAENKKKKPYKLWRDAAKTLSYGIAYGTTGRNIAETLNIMLGSVGFKIDQRQGDELIEKWYTLFPKTYAYLESNANKAVRDLYVTDAWGRRRNWHKEILYSTDRSAKWKRLAAMREGKNMPVQGSSASMTKRAIQLLWDRLDMKKARLIICVHDELIVESVSSYIEDAKVIIKECMEQALAEVLPAVADMVGKYEGLSVSPVESQKYDK